MAYLVAALLFVGPPLFFLPAMAARVFLPGLAEADMNGVYAIVCREVLPVGMIGMVIAAMFSATMSSLAGSFNAAAAVMVNELYLKFAKEPSARALMTYEGLFSTAVDLNLGYEALEQLFRRMAFNVLIEEVDDHTKNFSLLMKEGGEWELAPAYDLTGCHFSVEDKDFEAWSNPHVLSVNGKTGLIRDEDLLAVAARYGIGTAKRVLGAVCAAADTARILCSADGPSPLAEELPRRPCRHHAAGRDNVDVMVAMMGPWSLKDESLFARTSRTSGTGRRSLATPSGSGPIPAR